MNFGKIGLDDGISWHTKKLMRINQRITDDKLLLCFICKKYLGRKIWILATNCHVCKSCTESMGDLLQMKRNYKLEQQVNNYKYPCTAPYECHFIGTYEEALQHSARCEPSFKCTFCSCIVDKDDAIEHYLQQHCNNKLFASHEALFNKIIIPLPLKKDRIHILRSGHTDFILFIKVVNNEKLSVSIAKNLGFLGREFNRIQHDNFVVQWTNSETKDTKKAKGRTVSIEDYFGGKVKPIMMNMRKNKKERLEMKIQFNDLQTVKEASLEPEECPICFEVVVLKTMKCRNGHNVCHKCQLKIINCPFCREPMNIPMEAENMIPRRDVKCLNKNCLQVVCETRLAQHLEGNCAFETFNCPECGDNIPRLKMLEHLQKMHKKYFQGYEFYIHATEGSRTHYLMFKGKLFRLTIAVVGLTGVRTQRVDFKVQLMMEPWGTAEAQFRYELHFYKKPSAIMAGRKLVGRCQEEDDDDVGATINCNALPRLLTAPNNARGFFRIFLFSSPYTACAF